MAILLMHITPPVCAVSFLIILCAEHTDLCVHALHGREASDPVTAGCHCMDGVLCGP